MLMFEPEGREERQALQTFNPCIAPASAHNRRIKRTRLIGEHDRAPPQVIIEQQTAHVVDVVAETVVGRIGGDDCLECWRTAGRDLKAIEATPALAHHADIAAAPRLRRNPGDDFERIVLFLLDIFVSHVAVGFTRATHINADRGIAVLCEIAMHWLIAAAGAVALAVWNIFEHGRNGIFLGAFRQPQARTKTGAILQSDPQMLGDVYGHDRFHLLIKSFDAALAPHRQIDWY